MMYPPTIARVREAGGGSAVPGTPDLIDRLVHEFRELRIALMPDDFGDDGDIGSVDDLIGAVAGSTARPGANT
jgi:hypothetical protein